MTEAFPLQWPSGYERTFQPKNPPFKLSLAKARDHLLKQVEQLGGKSVVISSNAVLKRDGLPSARQPQMADVGVAVYFQHENQQVALACDKWDDLAANIRAVGLTVEAMRGMERWGVSQMLKRAFTGFKALPSATSTDSRTWQQVLGLTGIVTWDRVSTVYKKRRVEAHPDRGGTNAEFQAVQTAYETAKAKFGYK